MISYVKKQNTKYKLKQNMNKKEKKEKQRNKLVISLSLYSLSQQANMDCVNSYWLNWIKWNEYCENDSIEIVRSVFIWNMWFVDSSMKNQSCIVKIQSKNGFNKHKEGKMTQYLNSEHNPLFL